MMDRMMQYLQMYLDHFHSNESLLSDRRPTIVLHYDTRRNKTFNQPSSHYALRAYGERARKACLDVPENVYPHMFRHSRAMHLYQNGMDLILVAGSHPSGNNQNLCSC